MGKLKQWAIEHLGEDSSNWSNRAMNKLMNKGPRKKDIKWEDIDDFDFDGINHRDYPDYADAFIYYATWTDTGEELTEEELDILNDDTDFVAAALEKHLY